MNIGSLILISGGIVTQSKELDIRIIRDSFFWNHREYAFPLKKKLYAKSMLTCVHL